jgi:hypothetical protein
MFVQSGYRWVDESRLASIHSLFSTSTLSEIGKNENETLFDRLVILANSFVDGVFSIFELRADRIEVASELCVDSVCINAGDLRALLEAQNTDKQRVEVMETPTETPDSAGSDSDTAPEADSGTDSGTASSTEKLPEPEEGMTATTTQPVATSTASTASTTELVTDEEKTASTTEPVSDTPVAETEPEVVEDTPAKKEVTDEPEVTKKAAEKPVSETEPEVVESETEPEDGGEEAVSDTAG